MSEKVTADTLVGQIVREHPEAAGVLLSIGMHCLGCPASQMESLQDACAVHGTNVDELVHQLNEFLAEAK